MLLTWMLLLIMILYNIISTNDYKEWTMLIIPSLFVIGSSYFTMFSIFSKVQFRDEIIIITSWYGRKRKYNIADVHLKSTKTLNAINIYRKDNKIGKVGIFDKNFDYILKKIKFIEK